MMLYVVVQYHFIQIMNSSVAPSVSLVAPQKNTTSKETSDDFEFYHPCESQGDANTTNSNRCIFDMYTRLTVLVCTGTISYTVCRIPGENDRWCVEFFRVIFCCGVEMNGGEDSLSVVRLGAP